MPITRVRPIADVVLREQGHRHEYERLRDERLGGTFIYSYADGYGQSRHMTNLFKHEESILRNDWREKGTNTGSVLRYTDFVVPEADGAYLCRPYLDKWQAVRYQDFTYSPDAGDFEEADANVGVAVDHLGNTISQYRIDMINSAPNEPARVAESKFCLPPNPFFCVALNRQEPHADHEGDAYVGIIFGASATEGYALYIPFGGSPLMARYKGEKRVQFIEDERGTLARDVWTGVWSSGENDSINLKLPSSEGWPKGERIFIWIGVIGGRIAVSTDGFQKDVTLWRPAKEDELLHFDYGEVSIPSVLVREGLVGIEGQGCAFSFSFYACRMFDTMFRSLPIPALYKTEDSAGSMGDSRVIQPWWPITGELEPISEQLDGTPLVALTTRTPPKGNEYVDGAYQDLVGRGWFGQWDLELKPRVDYCRNRENENDYTLQSGKGFFAYRSPQVTGVTFSQRGVVTAGSLAVDATVDEEDVPGFYGSRAPGGESARFELRLDNEMGNLKSLGSRRVWEISPGWALNDDGLSADPEYEETALLFGGYALQPVMGIDSGGAGFMEIPLQDDFLRFGEMRIDGRVPSFDTFLVSEAMEWGLLRCGIPTSKIDIEETGRRLPFKAAEWLNLPQPGLQWVDWFLELCSYDHNAGFWIEPDGTVTKGCRYCRSLRTGVNPALDSHWRNHRHWNDSGCQAVDLARASRGVYAEYYTRGGKATDPETGYGEMAYVEHYSERLPGLEFATHVQVSGKDARGRPVTVIANCEAAVRDETDARFSGGWPIFDMMHFDDAVLSLADAVDRARSRAGEVCQVNHFATIRTPFDVNMKRGYTFQINGAENVGLDGVGFRCVGLIYDMDRTDIRRWPATNVIGRRLAHPNAPVIPI